MYWKRPQVLGVEPESFWTGVRGAAAPAAANRLSPEVLKPVGGQLGIAPRVLDVLVAEPRLQRAGVVAGIGQGVAAAVPQHMRVDRERHFGPLSDPAE